MNSYFPKQQEIKTIYLLRNLPRISLFYDFIIFSKVFRNTLMATGKIERVSLLVAIIIQNSSLAVQPFTKQKYDLRNTAIFFLLGGWKGSSLVCMPDVKLQLA